MKRESQSPGEVRDQHRTRPQGREDVEDEIVEHLDEPEPPEPPREETIHQAADGLRRNGWSVVWGNVHCRDFISVEEANVVLFESEDPAVCYVWQDGEVVGHGRRNCALRVVEWLLERHDESAGKAGGQP